jgi:hypothetical protein
MSCGLLHVKKEVIQKAWEQANAKPRRGQISWCFWECMVQLVDGAHQPCSGPEKVSLASVVVEETKKDFTLIKVEGLLSDSSQIQKPCCALYKNTLITKELQETDSVCTLS